MCFVNITNEEEAKIAKKDIKVYKWLRTRWYDDKLKSPCQNKIWTVGVVARARLAPRVSIGIVEYGFHSFKSKKAAADLNYGGMLYACIIPKGSKYYVNKTQYVSNRMYLLTGRPLKY